MILYRHAPNKAALLDGVAETVLAQLHVDSADPDWAGQLRQVARRFRALALVHPHVVPLIVTRPLATPLGAAPSRHPAPPGSHAGPAHPGRVQRTRRPAHLPGPVRLPARPRPGRTPGTHRQARRDRRPAPARPAPAADQESPCSAASPPSWPPTTAPPNSNAASTSCSPASPPPSPRQAKPARPRQHSPPAADPPARVHHRPAPGPGHPAAITSQEAPGGPHGLVRAGVDAENDMPAEDLAATLAAGLMRPADAEGSTRACPHGPPAWWADYDLLYETVATLEALLPSPQPASTGCQLDGRATGDPERDRPAARACQAGRGNDHPGRLHHGPEPHSAGCGGHRAGIGSGIPGRYPRPGLRAATAAGSPG